MSAKKPIQWFRVIMEGALIVGSILMAFGIQAWWDHHQERMDERASLELLSRDLSETVEQFREFESLMAGTVSAANSAYTALAGPPELIDHDSVSALLIRAAARRTTRLPSAAYTDLLSTGSLRLISDRGLRDQVVRFYEAAERSQDIIEKNNSVFIDGLLWTDLFGSGLVLFVPTRQTGVGAIDSSIDSVRTHFGEGFSHPTDPLWRLQPASPEWDRVRGTLLLFSQAASTSGAQASEVLQNAADLRELIEQSLKG